MTSVRQSSMCQQKQGHHKGRICCLFLMYLWVQQGGGNHSQHWDLHEALLEWYRFRDSVCPYFQERCCADCLTFKTGFITGDEIRVNTLLLKFQLSTNKSFQWKFVFQDSTGIYPNSLTSAAQAENFSRGILGSGGFFSCYFYTFQPARNLCQIESWYVKILLKFKSFMSNIRSLVLKGNLKRKAKSRLISLLKLSLQ